MKNLAVTMMIAVTLCILSCKKDDNSSTSSTTSVFITTGKWHVTYYHESNNDRTISFKGYTFTFASGGQMTATDSLNHTTNGTWSNDDSHNELHLSIGSSSPLNDISNGWTVITSTSTELDLKDDNSAHNEEMHFTKN